MTPSERATQAAIATAWILDETPERVHTRLLNLVDLWQGSDHASLGQLWHAIRPLPFEDPDEIRKTIRF